MKYGIPTLAGLLALGLSLGAHADGATEAALRSTAIDGASDALGRCTASALAVTSAKTGKTFQEQPARSDKQAYGLYVQSLLECLKTVQEALNPPLKALEQDLKLYAS